MQVIKSINHLEVFHDLRESGSHSLGFVPTMGALHAGHLSLISRAKRENDLVIASVFVNPMQFNDPTDFEKYPRQLEEDLAKLQEAGCDAAFCPEVKTIYPSEDAHQYNLGGVSERLEGAFRPGHFNGVASVVKRLLELIKPNNAYFGLKDYQQFLVIKALVANYQIPVKIIGCETVRDPDGLAMSSRNQLLGSQDRRAALSLYNALSTVKSAWASGQNEGLKTLGFQYLQAQDGVAPEYFEIAEADTLTLLGDEAIPNSSELIALTAARVGGVRLIDNMRLG